MHLAHLHELGNDLGSGLSASGASSPTVISSGDGRDQLRVAGLLQLDAALQSLSLGRRRPNCWPRRLLRLLNFSFLPVGWFFALVGHVTAVGQVVVAWALNLSTFTSTVRVSTDWARLTCTCHSSLTEARCRCRRPVPAVTRFSLRFSAGLFSGLAVLLALRLFLFPHSWLLASFPRGGFCSGFLASAAGFFLVLNGGLQGPGALPWRRWPGRHPGCPRHSRGSGSSSRFSSFSPKVLPVLASRR